MREWIFRMPVKKECPRCNRWKLYFVMKSLPVSGAEVKYCTDCWKEVLFEKHGL